MSARSAASNATPKQTRVRRRRWPKVLGTLAVLSIILVLVAAHYLQPARLTALILDRASRILRVELHTTGPGSYALRPEPRLVLPGLSATVPGERAPFFRSARVELALPWSTLRGRSTDISSVVLKSPDIDLAGMQRWLATLPPRTTPLKLPTLTRGLRIDDGVLRGTSWRIDRIALALPALADGMPSTLAANGDFVHEASVSKFKMLIASTPAGMGHGFRIDNATISFVSDDALPSLTATGSMHDTDTFALELKGAMQRVPRPWAASIDSAFKHPGDIPFSIMVSDGAPGSNAADAASIAMPEQHLQVRMNVGDPRRQPALTLSGEASSNATLGASLHGQLSRWPDAWPGLPAGLPTNAAPIVFDASYRGSIFLDAPVEFAVQRASTTLQGRFRIADVRAWVRNKFDTVLPPIEATLHAPQIDVGGMQLRGVKLDVRDDAATTQPAAKSPAVVPKS